MKCANHWCAHHNEGQCEREEIELDIHSRCMHFQEHPWSKEFEEELKRQAEAVTRHVDLRIFKEK